jgi:outer membrane protein OmpA-like peptidoglycan-associated protein
MTERRLAALLLAFALTPGCAWWGERSSTTKGAVYGTGAGAAAGAAVGSILGGGEGAWKGAAVGAAIGGLSGGAVGYYLDQQKKEMAAVLERQDRIEREGETLRVSLASDVLFDSGSARLQPGADDKLRRVGDVLERYPRTRLEVVGHTDNRGTDASNQDLSERRAAAVRDVLVRDGVNPARITVRGVGETRPVATNDTLTGRAMNRRVELEVQPDDSVAAGDGGQRGAPVEEPR